MYKTFLFALLMAMAKAMPQNSKATADEISEKAASSSYGSGNAAVDALAAAAALEATTSLRTRKNNRIKLWNTL